MRRPPRICLAIIASGTLATAEPPQTQAESPAIRLVPAPPGAATRDRMRLWHRHYRDWISPVLREWETTVRAVNGRPGSQLTAGCRRLGLALEHLGHARLPVAPDPSVSLHLEQTLRSLSDAAHSCSHGAYFLTTWRLREADDSWRELRGRLLLYGLTP